jgi:membrane protein implicated in regulation of membrane protease activity
LIERNEEMEKGDRVKSRDRGGFYDGETAKVVGKVSGGRVRIRFDDGYQTDLSSKRLKKA